MSAFTEKKKTELKSSVVKGGLTGAMDEFREVRWSCEFDWLLEWTTNRADPLHASWS